MHTILIVGATGKTGRRVAARLRELGHPVIEGSRAATPPFDWENPSTWDAVLQGVRSAYVAYYPDIGFAGADEKIEAFAQRAADYGVQHLVLLSGRGEQGALRGEEAMKAAGVDWTVLRSSFFSQNFSENFFADMIRHGTVAFPAEQVREPFIDAEDIADLAVAALREPGHTQRTYEITGPELLTFPDAVTRIAAATGRQVQYSPITVEEFGEGMRGTGAPDEIVAGYVHLMRDILDGRNESVTDGVQAGLGRAPRSFAEYVQRESAAGAWS